jgi:hypothetical protein
MNTTMNTIPNSPNDMPPEWHNDARQIRNALVTLDQFACVDIHWERDGYDDEGNPKGEWEITVETNSGLRIRSRNCEITHALWFATQMADAAVQACYLQRKDAREAALAKLTTEERRMLGL